MIITAADTDNKQSKDFKLHRKNGREDYLFVLFKSPSQVWVDGSYVDVDKGFCIIFDKHKTQSYFPRKPFEFLHDFMHFDLESDYEEMLLSDIPKGRLIELSQPDLISSSIHQIKTELNSVLAHKDNILSLLGTVFLYRLKDEVGYIRCNRRDSANFKNLYNLRMDIFKNPQDDWSIDVICKRVCLSRSYFQHLYKEFFETTCVQDIISARITMAKNLLLSSEYSVQKISEMCGYQNVTHFIRQFKNTVGTSPDKFRYK